MDTTLHPFVHLSHIEQHLGFPFEDRPPSGAPLAISRTRGTARDVLDGLLLDALTSGPCFFTFSGGRDSSALLAVATDVARREGLALPVPITAVYPGAGDAEESEWQHRVLDHLQLRERIVVTIRDERRVLGESARAAIRRHGVMWPEAMQLQAPLLGQLSPGSVVVSGEGGDNVITGARMAPFHTLVHRWPPQRRALRAAIRSLGGGLRTSAGAPWYTERARACGRRAERSLREPLLWNARTRAVIATSAARVLFSNVRAAIAELGLHPVLPFIDPTFVDALALEGGRLGLGGRGLVFEHLVGDVLPREVIFRGTKAAFNETRWGVDESDFARQWDGTGIDPELIDLRRLRQEWMGESPHPMSHFQLQVAWAASDA